MGNRIKQVKDGEFAEYSYNNANELIYHTYTSSAVTVSGFAADTDEDGGLIHPAAVTVNGVPALIEGTSFTAFTVPIMLGVNRLRAMALDSAGNASFVSPVRLWMRGRWML